MYGRENKLIKQKTQNKIRYPFISKKTEKEIIDRIIKDRIIEDVWTLFDIEEEEKEKKKLEGKKRN